MKVNKIEQVLKLLQANPKIKTSEVMAKLGTAKSYTYVLMSKARKIHKPAPVAPLQTVMRINLIEPKPDPVNNPAHYTAGGIETIDFIEAKKLNYNIGNVVKYLTRADHKGNKLEDLRKAQWYLTREINSLK